MSSKKTATIPVAVFDISSSSVGGAHALIKKGSHERVSVLAQSRVAAALQEDLNIERFVSETLKGIESVATTIRTEDVHHPEYIQVVLASPWYTSQTRTIVYNKTVPFLCTEKLVTELIDKEIAFILASETDRFGALGHEYVIVEKQISLIKLNGYATHTPYGKHAKSLELYLTVTIAPKRVIEQFTDLLRRIYGTRNIGITTSAYTTFVTTREYDAVHQECVIVDIGEEVTDVAFVKDQLFLYQHSFPVGTYELHRSVVARTGNAISEVPGILEAYRLQKLSKRAAVSVATAIADFATTWQKGLQAVVDAGHYGRTLPRVWYVVVEPRFEKIITDTLFSDPYLEHKTGAAVSVHTITPQSLSSVKSAHDTTLDVPLALALLFIDRLV